MFGIRSDERLYQSTRRSGNSYLADLILLGLRLELL